MRTQDGSQGMERQVWEQKPRPRVAQPTRRALCGLRGATTNAVERNQTRGLDVKDTRN